MITVTTTSKEYFLPEDGNIAESDLLVMLENPSKVYVDCYGLGLPGLAERLVELDAKHIPIDINCDHLQSTGPSVRPVLLNMFSAFQKSGTGSCITITSAGDKSEQTSQIYHKKCIVVKCLDGGEDYCLEGSTNLTCPAWCEANTMRIFRSNAWSAAAIQAHDDNKVWALNTHPEWQLVNIPKAMLRWHSRTSIFQYIMDYLKEFLELFK